MGDGAASAQGRLAAGGVELAYETFGDPSGGASTAPLSPPQTFFVLPETCTPARGGLSKRLREDIETAAGAGSHASMISEAPAAVVLSGQVLARTDADPRVAGLRARLLSETGKTVADLHHELAEVTRAVRPGS
jgi:hypothetical protein